MTTFLFPGRERFFSLPNIAGHRCIHKVLLELARVPCLHFSKIEYFSMRKINDKKRRNGDDTKNKFEEMDDNFNYDFAY